MAASGEEEKVRLLIRRQEECKTAFRDLRSQIHLGLMEAKEVFDSLSVPLMKLVGLKTVEIAGDGRSSSVHLSPDLLGRTESFCDGGRSPMMGVPYHRSNETNASVANGRSPFPGVRHRTPDEEEVEEEEKYISRAREASEKLKSSQNQSIRHQIHLLRGVEHHVKARHGSLLQALDSHRDSLHQFLVKSTTFLSSLPHSHPTVTAHLTSRILRAAAAHAASALDAAEDEADSLVESLAEQMCVPMVAHVKSLRSDALSGPATLIPELVGELERAMAEKRKAVAEMEVALGVAMVEVGKARKRARLEEAEKVEAMRLLREYQQKFRAMREIFVGSFSECSRQNILVQRKQLLGSGDDDDYVAVSRPVTRSCTRDVVAQRTPSPVVQECLEESSPSLVCGAREVAASRMRNRNGFSSPVVR